MRVVTDWFAFCYKNIAFGLVLFYHIKGDKMNYSQTLEYIHSMGNFSLPAGLIRMNEVMKKLDNPQNKIKAIHIAGTNGKGSVSAMLASIFKTAGYKTGLFISPFIIDFRERIQINGEFISEEDLVYYSQRIIDTKIRLTEFEFITAVAFLYFADKEIDILICETGLGGRLDATNILQNKIVNVITKIGLDHTTVLGNTIEEITAEKCGIIKNSPTVTTYNQLSSVINVIKKYTDKLYIPDKQKLSVLNDVCNTYMYNGKKYTLSLSGDYQLENSLVAIKAIEVSGYDIPYNIIYKGLKNAVFPARMEIISKNPLVVLDGAHNPDGAEVLSKELSKQSDITAIIGMMRDKDVNAFLEQTLKYCKSAVAVEVSNMPRSMSAKELCDIANKICPCEIAEDYATAIKKAMKKSCGKPIFVFGSLYLASAIRPFLKDFFKDNLI